MKKYLSISFLLFSITSFSQAPTGFYPKVGFSQTSLDSKDLLTTSNPGFLVGLNFNLGYHESYNFQAEFSYNHNTLNIKNTDINYFDVKETKFNYSNLELGFYVNYYIIKPDEDKFYIGPQAGTFFSFLNPITPSKGADVSGQYYLPYLLNENSLQNAAEFNYGLGLGFTGGYNKFRFDLRYSLGFANILKGVETNSVNQNNLYTGPTLEGKTRGLSLAISYKIL